MTRLLESALQRLTRWQRRSEVAEAAGDSPEADRCMEHFAAAISDVEERSSWRKPPLPPSRAAEFTDTYLAVASDDQLEADFHTLYNDPAAVDRVQAEMQRRDEAHQQQQEAAQWAAAWGFDDPNGDAPLAEADSAGLDDDAIAELEWAYQHLSPAEYQAVERNLITDPAMRSLDRRTAAAADRQMREDYADWQFERYMEAENVCRGHLLNKRGQSLGVDSSTLLFGNDKRMRAYASDEFKAVVGRLGGHVSFARFSASRNGPNTQYGAHNLETFDNVAYA